MAVQLHNSVPREVCLIRLSAIGDCCHTLPIVRTLQAAWPQTKFTWIIGRIEVSLFRGIDNIEFVIFEKGRNLSGFRDLRRKLRDRHYPLLLHMHPSMRANIVSRMIRADTRLGYDRARAKDRQWLFTNCRIKARPGQHVMDGMFGFVEALGIHDRKLCWDIPLDDSDYQFAASHVGNRPTVLVISPCSSQRFRNYRNWRPENYAAIADYTAENYDAQVIITGGDTPLEHEYGHRISELSKCSPVNLVGQTTLKQLLAILARASVLVCPDSGPAHMATTVGTPIVGLYATSNRLRTGPYFSQDLVVDKYPQAVREEFDKTVEEIPWGARVRNPDAMDLLEIPDVTAKIDQALAGT